ncbi:sensor histidine kinase [Sutcliffiella horikoshii]|uniref:sensor histidine kinase n=1 Tax=Sutcliffiella horikoshii TaxID=79883 RepID=UPI001CFD5F3B|nr:HAMP domain-containing sensor histidine kinase [Sutcliffiella horikoshii]
MKLKTLLAVTNGLSILLFLLFLVISYVQMFLSKEVVLLLTVITLVAGAISFLAFYVLINPLLKVVDQVSKEAQSMANGNLEVKMKEAGPKEIKQVAKNFNEMAIQIKEKIEDIERSEQFKSELIANVSHDLRTPIASIRSFTEALEDNILQDEETKKRYLSIIKQETLRLGDLIEELLYFSKLEQRSIPYTPVLTPVDDLLLQSLGPFESMLSERGIEVKVEMNEEISSVLVMPEKIIRVLNNLFKNAITYSPSNATIFIKVTNEQNSLRFQITDEGPGIEQEEQERIFERFYRTEKSRNKAYGGSGLGLAIAKELIEWHGGTLGVVSKWGKGSTFWFTIPYEKERGRDEEDYHDHS